MRHPIDSKSDLFFNVLLGAEADWRLLIRFLNAVLGAELACPVVEVLDPYHERELLDHKLSMVDVKARDARQRVFQVEIQLLAVHDN